MHRFTPPSLPANSKQLLLIFSLSSQFCFLQNVTEWESVRSLFRLAFFTESQALKGPPCLSFHDLIAHFITVLNNIPLSGGTSLFIHSPAEGHLGCFLVLSSMNKAAINIHLCIFCVHTTFQLSWVKYQGW